MRCDRRPACVEPLETRQLLAAYHLSFDDEFNSLNLANGASKFGWLPYDYWNDRFYPSNGEQQYYCNPQTDAYNPFSINNGVLSITAKPTPAGVSTTQPYVSGEITTSTGSQWSNPKSLGFSQQYGYFELRAKLPAGKGFWPAFWLLPADGSWPPEDDIFEMLGHQTTTIYQTAHWGTSSADHQSQSYTYAAPFDWSTGFHTYGFLWTASSISWYVDGVLTQTQVNRINVPMYILVNLAVGGNWPGNPDATTPFPSSMSLDYIRVYSSDPSVPAVSPDVGSVPTGWSDTDIGSPGFNGFAGYSAASGAWTVSGCGSDIWNTSDQFNFASKPMAADGEMIAQLGIQTITDTWAKAGLMLRASTAADAPFALLAQVPDGELAFQWRTASSASATWGGALAGGTAANKWIRLVRSGSNFSAYYATTTGTPTSSDWVQIGSPVSIVMPDLVLAGLAVSSHNTAVPGSATFTNVSVNDSIPTVQSVVINGGAAQRSMVTKLSVTFSENVTVSNSTFSLLNRAGSVVPGVTLNAINTSGDQKTWDITFSGSGVSYGSLADGAYRLLISASTVHDLAGTVMAADVRQRFFRLFGDSNGDRRVDRTDLTAFRQALAGGTYVGYFDYDNSNSLTLADYAQLRRRMIKRVLM